MKAINSLEKLQPLAPICQRFLKCIHISIVPSHLQVVAKQPIQWNGYKQHKKHHTHVCNLQINKNRVNFPNPLVQIQYQALALSPATTLSTSNLNTILTTPKVVKRQISSTVATLTTSQLLDMCNLTLISNEVVRNQDILAGCLTGIVYYCQTQPIDYWKCHGYYDTVFDRSTFKAIGTCAPWRSGPSSAECSKAVNGFTATNTSYSTVTKEYASFFATVVFANKLYAPCNSNLRPCKSSRRF